MKIIVVCTGNTCRSPMAEALIKQKFPEHDVISRGLYVAVPSGPSKNACETMANMGIDITKHISCQLDENEVKEADLVLTMTKAHKDKIISVVPEAEGSVFTICEYASMDGEVSDPFGGDLKAYEKCAEIIKECVEKMKL